MTPAQIKKFREDNGLSQQGLAERLGVDQATVSRIEGGAAPARPVAILLQRIMDEASEAAKQKQAAA